MNKVKKALLKRDPTKFFSGFVHKDVTVMVYIPYDKKEKDVWLVRFYRSEELIETSRFKRQKDMGTIYPDMKVLQELQDNIDKVLETLCQKEESTIGE